MYNSEALLLTPVKSVVTNVYKSDDDKQSFEVVLNNNNNNNFIIDDNNNNYCLSPEEEQQLLPLRRKFFHRIRQKVFQKRKYYTNNNDNDNDNENLFMNPYHDNNDKKKNSCYDERNILDATDDIPFDEEFLSNNETVSTTSSTTTTMSNQYKKNRRFLTDWGHRMSSSFCKIINKDDYYFDTKKKVTKYHELVGMYVEDNASVLLPSPKYSPSLFSPTALPSESRDDDVANNITSNNNNNNREYSNEYDNNNKNTNNVEYFLEDETAKQQQQRALPPPPQQQQRYPQLEEEEEEASICYDDPDMEDIPSLDGTLSGSNLYVSFSNDDNDVAQLGADTDDFQPVEVQSLASDLTSVDESIWVPYPITATTNNNRGISASHPGTVYQHMKTCLSSDTEHSTASTSSKLLGVHFGHPNWQEYQQQHYLEKEESDEWNSIDLPLPFDEEAMNDKPTTTSATINKITTTSRHRDDEFRYLGSSSSSSSYSSAESTSEVTMTEASNYFITTTNNNKRHGAFESTSEVTMTEASNYFITNNKRGTYPSDFMTLHERPPSVKSLLDKYPFDEISDNNSVFLRKRPEQEKTVSIESMLSAAGYVTTAKHDRKPKVSSHDYLCQQPECTESIYEDLLDCTDT